MELCELTGGSASFDLGKSGTDSINKGFSLHSPGIRSHYFQKEMFCHMGGDLQTEVHLETDMYTHVPSWQEVQYISREMAQH